MFKIVGEYKGTIKNGFMLSGENFFPGRKRTIKVDEIQLKKLTKGEENGWFVIHSCQPANPFLKIQELVKETTEETPVEETPVEETPVEETLAEEIKEEAPKKKTSRSKKKVEEKAE